MKSKPIRLGTEMLEERQLLAVSSVVLHSDGWLAIAGSVNSDALVVVERDSKITVGGWKQSFDASKVKGIRITGGTGNDVIVNDTKIQSVILGGDGHDFIVGGAAADLILGEAGNDYLFGMGGDDYLFGGAQADYLVGGSGWDRTYGESGYDIFDGSCELADLYWGDQKYWDMVTPAMIFPTYRNHVGSANMPNLYALNGATQGIGV